jgi:hypothetical protein
VDGRTDLAEFSQATLKRLGVGAIGVAPRDLRHGVAFLRDLTRRTGAPVICANLTDPSGRLLFPGTRLVTVSGVRVGVLALLGERLDLGPARDSLRVTDPEAAAQAAVADLRARGAQVVVLLSQLGKAGGEDLAFAVPGIDVVFLGHEVPMIDAARRVGDALALYTGEQGQHAGLVTVDLSSGVAVGDGAVRVLGPDLREDQPVLADVKRFEDAYNERMREYQRRLDALAAADPEQDPVDHFVGGAVCARCHADEASQWRTTAHSLAWETLVREKKDSTPDCIPCHVVGYRQPGGFQSMARTPGMADVQCENCHGMGTRHESGWMNTSLASMEATCRSCHRDEHDPEFDYAVKHARITHGNTSGESIRIVTERRKAGYGQVR